MGKHLDPLAIGIAVGVIGFVVVLIILLMKCLNYFDKDGGTIVEYLEPEGKKSV